MGILRNISKAWRLYWAQRALTSVSRKLDIELKYGLYNHYPEYSERLWREFSRLIDEVRRLKWGGKNGMD